MPRTNAASIENHFIGGLKTEFTGLNFPENACTDTDNCVFSIVGDVTRRLGFDFEANPHMTNALDRASKAVSSYKWTNVGGDGSTQVFVLQVGGTLHFFRITDATLTSPISNTKLSSTITLSNFTPAGGASPDAVECQYADGNGYLFVFHPNLEPFYCTYSAGTITATAITVQRRDFEGIIETGIADNFRPLIPLTPSHQYNLQNQGWTTAPGWTATSTTSVTYSTGVKTFTIQTGLTITGGDTVTIHTNSGFPFNLDIYMYGTVTSYTSGTGSLVVSVTSLSHPAFPSGPYSTWDLTHPVAGKIVTFFTNNGVHPSNVDVWWRFKNSSDVFDPTTTIVFNVTNVSPAPKGSYILEAFNLNRSGVSGVAGITTISTLMRPKTGAWFQGRIWYVSPDAANFSEKLYFSQIVENVSQLGKCYQVNDPTSEDLFDLLPSDGGVIKIQGCGSIYKLFSIQNGLLVFAANGIWFITGSQGIGFTANDYTVTKISSIQSISSSSFVNVQGYPTFWNEEGIYAVAPGQQGNLEVNNLCLGTILSFYADIPLASKKYVKGDYNPLTYILQWAFRSTNETNVTTRYEYNRILNYNVSSKSFYPYTLVSSMNSPHIHGISYISGPGGSTSPEPVFKYITSAPSGGSYNWTFSEEIDPVYKDWFTTEPSNNYVSYFITGYKIHGQALKKFQPLYIYVYSRNDEETSYKIQGIWNFATSGNSGKFSTVQVVTISQADFDKVYRRHKIRGSGISLQFKIISVEGQPFDIMGWSTFETGNPWV